MKFEEFVRINKDNFSKYSDVDSINKNFTICKRENNSKRDFIIVQELLGKHVPKRPSQIFSYYEKLVDMIDRLKVFSRQETMLSQGLNAVFYFAETATAIGEYVANHKNLKINSVIRTTREVYNKEKLFEIFEDHCHAPKHYVYGTQQDRDYISKLKRLLIIDDEITSGNTVEEVITEIRKINPGIEIYVASFINLMTPERILEFSLNGIQIISLIFGSIIDEDKKVTLNQKVEPYNTDEFENSLLVLGTEEDMYNALMKARLLEEKGFNVYFQATTRSPIMSSNEDDYSLIMRKEVPSCKDPERKNYLYNLRKYKQIFIFRNVTGNKEFDERMNNLLGMYSIEPIKFYNYSEKEEY